LRPLRKPEVKPSNCNPAGILLTLKFERTPGYTRLFL
jgi:hypothetical protein